MRKGMAVMLSAALAGCLWGCNGEGENAEEVSLYAQGMDVIRLMQEMSQSEEYAGFISGSPELQDKAGRRFDSLRSRYRQPGGTV